MEYFVNNIQYDTDGETVDLPDSIMVVVPNHLEDENEIDDYVSDEISNETGFCHKGFSMKKMKYVLLRGHLHNNIFWTTDDGSEHEGFDVLHRGSDTKEMVSEWTNHTYNNLK